MAFTGTITGNIGRDPELKALQSGQMVATFSVAVRQPKVKGEDPPAFWVKVEVWGKTAEYASDYLKKGDQVFCSGEVRQEDFTRRDGTPGSAVVLKNARVEKFTSREAVAPAAVATPQPQAARPAPQPAASYTAMQDDDGIPF